MRGSEQVIRSALLHVKWDTVTSSPPRFLLSPEEKLYKGSQQRAAGLVFEWSSSVSSSLYKYPCFSTSFPTFLYNPKLSISVSGSLLKHSSLYCSLPTLPHFSPLISFIFFVIYDQPKRIKKYIANGLLLFFPISVSKLYRSALSLCTAEYACVGVEKVLLWRPFATTDAMRRDLYMTF